MFDKDYYTYDILRSSRIVLGKNRSWIVIMLRKNCNFDKHICNQKIMPSLCKKSFFCVILQHFFTKNNNKKLKAIFGDVQL